MTKIGRNEPCWCGSGRKFKKCHLNRDAEEAYSIQRLFAEIKAKSAHKACLHPNAGNGNCSKKIIDAHTIQKKGPLQQIIDSTNHVYRFGTSTKTGMPEVQALGWQKASTFKGFCGAHDKEMFSPIEDGFYDGSAQQTFIAGYRAYALEYFKKVSVLKCMPFMRDNFDRGLTMDEQKSLQADLHAMKNGFLKGMDDLKESLDMYISHYNSGDLESFKLAAIFFNGDLSVVSSGVFAPDFAIDGRRLQSLAPGVRFVENLAVNTLVTENEFALVFSWPNNYDSCTTFVESLLAIEDSKLPSRMVELLFSYIENTYFSKEWLENLPALSKKTVAEMADNPIQYGNPIIFTDVQHTNWQVTRRIYQ